MSCNCIGNSFIDLSGNFQPLTEYMCFEIIAQNSACCESFTKNCLTPIYFDTNSDNYVGCYGCPSENTNCCYLIQIEANRLNPEENSQCCENFDSYCVEAYETLKSTKGNFCSDNSSLKDYYVNTYSTDYRPCNFSDEQADKCIAELDCSDFTSIECIDSLYNKLKDFNSACQCTCFKQANFIGDCMLHVLHKEPTCCHSWTQECENLRKELETTQGNICSLTDRTPIALLGGIDPPGGIGGTNCGCTIEGNDSAFPCEIREFFCNSDVARELRDSGIFSACNNFFDLINNIQAYSGSQFDQGTQIGSACCYDNISSTNNICNCDFFECEPCAEQGINQGCNLPWYDVVVLCDACAYALAQAVYGVPGGIDCDASRVAINRIKFAGTIAKAFLNGSGTVSASDCDECCALCQYIGTESSTCAATCGLPVPFIETITQEGIGEKIVREGEGITFEVYNFLSPYLYYSLNQVTQSPNPPLPFISQADIGAMGNGANGIPLGITGLIAVPGTLAIVHVPFVNNDSTAEGNEYFKFSVSEQLDIDTCPDLFLISETITVTEPVVYNLIDFPCTINEGNNFTLTINTTNVPNNTPIYYRIVPISGNLDIFDFDQPTSLNGSRNVISGQMNLNISVKNDILTESAEEKFKVQFSTDSNFTTIIATTDNNCSNGIKIIDTSQTLLNISVTANGQGGDLSLFVSEGDGITFAVTSNQIGTFYYTIDQISGNIESSDFISTTVPPANTSLGEAFAITQLSPATKIHKKLNLDQSIESIESFKLNIRTNSIIGDIKASSPQIFISDTSQGTSIVLKAFVEGTEFSSGTDFTVQEDKIIRFEVTSNNSGQFRYSITSTNEFGSNDLIADNTVIPAANIQLSESINLTANTAFNIHKRIKKDDFDTENESFIFKIQNSAGTQDIVSTGTVTVTNQPVTVTIKVNNGTGNISVNEGDLVTFDIISNYNGNNYSYGINGTIEPQDFIFDGNVFPQATEDFDGSFVVTNGTAKINKRIRTDAITDDSNDSFSLTVYRSGVDVGTSPTVTISDTSQTVFYSVSGPTTVQEGESYNYTVNTINSAFSTLYYRIKANGTSAVTSADFTTAITGSFTVSMSGNSSFDILVGLAAFDGQEVTEFFDIEIWPTADFTGTRLAIQSAIKIIDVTSSATITHLPSVVEGQGITFVVQTTNVTTNFLQYQIEQVSGTITANDFNPSSLNGSFSITDFGSFKQGTLGLTTRNNSDVENDEFRVDIYNPSNGNLLVSSNPVRIIDAAPTFTYVNPSPTTIVEGENISYTVNTTNYSGPLYYRLASVAGAQIQSDDIDNFNGSITISNNTGTLTLRSLITDEHRGSRIFRPLFSQIENGSEITATNSISSATLIDPTPTYEIVNYPPSVAEGQSFNFTVQTTNLVPGTTLYYKFEGAGIVAADFVGGITGSITVTGNPASATKTIITINNPEFEGSESFHIRLYSDSSLTTQVASTTGDGIFLNEGPASYTLSPPSGNLFEGTTTPFTFTTQNVSNGIKYYKIEPISGSGVNASDFTPNVLNGSFSFSANSGSFALTLASNPEVELNDKFKIGIYTASTFLPASKIFTSGEYTIKDATPTYSITANKNSVSEGDGITFTVQTTNIPNGTTLIYYISGSANALDFVPSGITGVVTINSNFYNFHLGISADLVSEGGETFDAVIKFNDSGPDLSNKTDTITITDTSSTFYEIDPSTTDIIEGDSQLFTVTSSDSGFNGTLYYGITSIKGGPILTEEDFEDGLTAEFDVDTGVGLFAISPVRDDLISGRRFTIKVGTTNDPYNSSVVSSGVINVLDLAQDYTLTSDTDVIKEGERGVLFEITTSNVPDGTVINYSIEGIQGSIENIDFTDGLLDGTLTINGGVASLYKEATSDGNYEGTEVFNIFFTVNGDNIQSSPKQITILDANPTFDSITPFGCTICGCAQGIVKEGETINFSVVGSNINPSENYIAILEKFPSNSSFSSEDVNPISQTINFTNNISTFSVDILTTGTNTLFEGNDYFKVHIRPSGASNNLISSGCFRIVNADPTGSIQPTQTTLSEGEGITFNIAVQNVPDNSRINYEITGIQEEDLIDNQLTGEIVVVRSGNEYIGSIGKRLSTDDIRDEVESLQFAIYYNNRQLAITNPIPITDTSSPPIREYNIQIIPVQIPKGSAFKIIVTTVNVPSGTPLFYEFVKEFGPNLVAEDFDPPSLNGQLIIKSSRAERTIGVSEELATTKRFRLKLYEFTEDTVPPALIGISDYGGMPSFITSSLDYEVWGAHFSPDLFVGNQPIYTFNNPQYKLHSIVPTITSNATANPDTGVWRNPGDTDASAFTPDIMSRIKNDVEAIPPKRRVLNAEHWWKVDVGCPRNYHDVYYKNTPDGMTYIDGDRVLTCWLDTNAQDCSDSFGAFLQKCVDAGITFDYVMSDQEEQSNYWIDGRNSFAGSIPAAGLSLALRDSRRISAIVQDSRFTNYEHPITNKTFAEEFMENYQLLRQKNGFAPDTRTINEILNPFINANSFDDYKPVTNYWQPYGCENGCGPDGKTIGGLIHPEGYNLYFHVAPAWRAVADNWHFNVYLKQFRDKLDEFEEFRDVIHLEYNVDPVNENETRFFQLSNLEVQFQKTVLNTWTGDSKYYGGDTNLIFPSWAGAYPDSSPAGPWSLINQSRSGYVRNPQNDYEKYNFSGYLVDVYKGPAGNDNLVRYPEVYPFIGEDRDDILLRNWYREYCFKMLVYLIKLTRHHLRSDLTHWNNFAPWIGYRSFPFAKWTRGGREGYWEEMIRHVLVSGARFIQIFESLYDGFQCSLIHDILDEWRHISGNSRAQPCSNENGATDELVDNLILHEVFDNILISGGRLLNSPNRYVWRITVAPKHFNSDGLCILYRQNSDEDLPETITIDSNTDNTTSRGVWIRRFKQGMPKYGITPPSP